MKKILTLVLCALCSCLAVNAALEEKEARTITVKAKASAKAQPDMAHVSFSIISREKSASSAREDNAKKSKKVVNAIKDLGIDEKFIKLEQLRINEQREYDSEQRKSIFKGFEARRTFSIKVHDLDKLPALVEKAVDNGSNELQNLEYTLRDTDELTLKALAKAAQKAKEKAIHLAKSLEVQLGEALTINEDYSDAPRPFMTRKLAALDFASAESAAGEPDAFSGGEIEVSSSITVKFALKD